MNSDDDLIRKAQAVSRQAYAPYSRFRVGAAIRTVAGKTFVGCNVENASYGLTCCAERSAIFQMIAAGEKQFECIVIYTPTATPTAPCGACRQVLFEFGPKARVLGVCDANDRIDTTVEELLPLAFGPSNLS